MAKFNGLLTRRPRNGSGACAGYIEQLTYARPVKVLTSDEIRALYPGVRVVRKPMTEEETKARVLKNAKTRSYAMRNNRTKSNFE